MALRFLLYVFICCVVSVVQARETPAVRVKAINDGDSYISTVKGSHKVVRRSIYSGDVIQVFEGLNSQAIEIYIDTLEQTLAAIDSSQVVVWKLSDASEVKRAELPPVFWTVNSLEGELVDHTFYSEGILYWVDYTSFNAFNLSTGINDNFYNSEAGVSNLKFDQVRKKFYYLSFDKKYNRHLYSYSLKDGKNEQIRKDVHAITLRSDGALYLRNTIERKQELLSASGEVLVKSDCDPNVLYYVNVRSVFFRNTPIMLESSGNGFAIIQAQNGNFQQQLLDFGTIVHLQVMNNGLIFMGSANGEAGVFDIQGPMVTVHSPLEGDEWALNERLTLRDSSLDGVSLPSVPIAELKGDQHFVVCKTGQLGTLNGGVFKPFNNRMSSFVSKLVYQNKLLYVCSEGRVVSWDPKSGDAKMSYRAHTGMIHDAIFTKSGKYMLTYGSDGKLFLWDVNEVSVLEDYTIGMGAKNIQVADDLKITYTLNGEVHVLENQRLYTQLERPELEILLRTAHSEKIRDFAVSADREKAVSVDESGQIKFWMLKDLIPYAELQLEKYVDHVMFVNDDKGVIASTTKKLFLLDASSGKLIRETDFPVAFGNSYMYFKEPMFQGRGVTISTGNSPFLINYNVVTNKFNYMFNTRHEQYMNNIVSNSNSSLIASYGGKKVKVWNTKDFTLVNELPQQEPLQNFYSAVRMEFSPNSEVLAFEQKDTIVFYSLKDQQRIYADKAQNMVFTSDSTVILYTPTFMQNQYKWWKVNVFTGEVLLRKFIPVEVAFGTKLIFDEQSEKLIVASGNRIVQVDANSLSLIERGLVAQASRLYGSLDPNNGDLILANRKVISTFQPDKILAKDTRPSKARHIIFSDDGKYRIEAGGFKGHVYNALTNELISEFDPGNLHFISRDNQFIYVFDFLGSHVNQIDLQTGEIVNDFTWDPVKINYTFCQYNPASDELALWRFKTSKNYGTMSFLEQEEYRKKHLEVVSLSGRDLKQLDVAEFPSAYCQVDEIKVNEEYTVVRSDYLQFLIIDNNDGSFEKMKTEYSPEGIYFSKDLSKIYLVNGEGKFIVYDRSNGEKLLEREGHKAEITNMSWYGSTFLTTSEDGTAILWNADSHDPICTYVILDQDNSLIITPQLNYAGSPKAAEAIIYRKGNKYFPFEQFDLVNNRPDLVLKQMGNTNKGLLDLYHTAYKKRLKNLAEPSAKLSTELPELHIKNKDEIAYLQKSSQLTLDLTCEAPGQLLEALLVNINGVPVLGRNGKSLSGSKQEMALSLELTPGENTIELIVVDHYGRESERERINVFNELPKENPTLYFVGIGVRTYQDTSMNLKYADKDIRDMVQQFQEAQAYSKVVIDTLFNKDVTLENLTKLKTQLQGAKSNDVFVLMFSGHGLMDQQLNYYLAAYGSNFEDPSQGGIPYDLIDELVDACPARNRLVLIDACHSGEVDKDELASVKTSGVQATTFENSGQKVGLFELVGEQYAFDLMKTLFADLRRGVGATVISSSGGQYFSFEKDQYQNGVFTYAMKEGLEGAADFDNNGVVSVLELKDYVSFRVEELTEGKQRPTSRTVNRYMNFDLN